jgi:hypothetical protein
MSTAPDRFSASPALDAKASDQTRELIEVDVEAVCNRALGVRAPSSGRAWAALPLSRL